SGGGFFGGWRDHVVIVVVAHFHRRGCPTDDLLIKITQLGGIRHRQINPRHRPNFRLILGHDSPLAVGWATPTSRLWWAMPTLPCLFRPKRIREVASDVLAPWRSP